MVKQKRNKKKPAPKKQQRHTRLTFGSFAFKFVYFVAIMLDPMVYSGDDSKASLEDIPPFVIFLAIVLALVTIGLAVLAVVFLLTQR